MTSNQMVAYNQYMDKVFKALADESRRLLLDQLYMENGQTLSELCTHLDMSRQAVSKHLAILEEANLVVVIRNGRNKFHYLNAAPIGEIYERWIGKYERHQVKALYELKRKLEEENND
ncbi:MULTISPECIES: ArsR/SmtB family transcription factor [Heyndrickxia]|nr:metalloregulator ArsR/SmtB family transcription factor [Heyndrickxia shackletonii]